MMENRSNYKRVFFQPIFFTKMKYFFQPTHLFKNYVCGKLTVDDPLVAEGLLPVVVHLQLYRVATDAAGEVGQVPRIDAVVLLQVRVCKEGMKYCLVTLSGGENLVVQNDV